MPLCFSTCLVEILPSSSSFCWFSGFLPAFRGWVSLEQRVRLVVGCLTLGGQTPSLDASRICLLPQFNGGCSQTFHLLKNKGSLSLLDIFFHFSRGLSQMEAYKQLLSTYIAWDLANPSSRRRTAIVSGWKPGLLAI